MSDDVDVNLGPIDYLLVEFPGSRFNGEVLPALIDLVDRGTIRVLDLLFVVKGDDGTFEGFNLDEMSDHIPELTVFQGASSGLLAHEDAELAAQTMAPGSSAALLVYENRWAAPFAAAVRGSGGEVVANGRIPLEDLMDALDAAEAAS
ncbi:MAG: DUF6325 family protein [Acidimicrobiia bacterium]